MANHRDYWNSFYAGRSSHTVPDEPSAFARWTRERVAPKQPIVEFGFGNARDSLWWARNGHPVTGFDFAPSAVQQAQARANAESEGRHALMDLAAIALGGGGQMYVEFRTGQDAGIRHEFGDDHFRTFLDPLIVEAEIADRGGRIAYSQSGQGLAVYKTEDPHVARVVALWV